MSVDEEDDDDDDETSKVSDIYFNFFLLQVVFEFSELEWCKNISNLLDRNCLIWNVQYRYIYLLEQSRQIELSCMKFAVCI